MIERRETDRRRVCFGGLVRVAAFLPDMECVLRDVSLGGARIRIAPGMVLPSAFDLLVPCRGETRRARVVWRVGDAAGLGLEEARPDASPAEILDRLARSEAECARLRAAARADTEGRPARLH